MIKVKGFFNFISHFSLTNKLSLIFNAELY